MDTELRIPDRLARTVVSAFGDVGSDWLTQLPGLVADAASGWQLQVGEPYEPGGNVGWVAPVRRADGSEAALKVECPGHPNPFAPSGLRHWAGRGAVRLLDLHIGETSQVLLLERCVPGTNGDAVDAETADEAVASVLAELHAVEAPVDAEFETLATLAGRYRTTMWDWFERFGLPVDRVVVEKADELFCALSEPAPADAVLLHGDLGPSNLVLSTRGWLAIDPYPVLGDRSFDVGHSLSRCDLKDVRTRIGRFAEGLELDAGRIAGWTFACCVHVALECSSVGDEVGARRFLDRAEQLSAQRLV